MSKKTIYGLFVGIDQYDESIAIQNKAIFPILGGCVADVTAVRDWLKKDTSFDHKFVTLTDQQATKPAVVDAFEKHLGQAKKDDLVVFYYAGHGTQENADPSIWTTEQDGRLEGIVCHYNKGDAGKLILADKEIRWLLSRLWNKTKAHIFVAFDCCHSGDNTRTLGDATGEKVIARRARASISFNQRSWDDFVFAKEIKPQDFAGRSIEEIIPPGQYIQFSGAESNEPALETNGHGVFTVALLDSLKQSNGNLSYRDLHSRIRNRLRNRFEQRPKLYTPEGASDLSDRGFLLKPTTRNADSATMTFNDRAGYWIDRGSIHGVQSGLTVVQPVGTELQGSVEEVRLDMAKVNFGGSKPEKRDLEVSLSGIAARQVRIQLVNKDASDDIVDTLLQSLEKDYARYIALEDDVKKADYTLWLWRDMAYLTKPGDAFRPLFQPIDLTKATAVETLGKRLHHVSEWHYLASLSNKGRGALKSDLLEIEIVAIDPDGSETVLPVTDKKVLIELLKEDDVWRRSLKMQIKNKGTKDLYIAAAALSFDFSASAKYLLDPEVTLLSKGESKFLRDHRDGTFGLRLNDRCYWYNWEQSTDLVKILYSTEQFTANDFQLAELPAPDMPERQRSSFEEDDAERGAVLRGWNAIDLHLCVKNPLYNKVDKADIQDMLGVDEKGKKKDNADLKLGHFAYGLYCQDAAIKGKKMNRREGETDAPSGALEGRERGIVWDTTLAAANAWAGFWRGREYNKMLKKHPNQPRIVSEGDSWFQHPLLNDVIDNVSKFYPVDCLASAGDTITNYVKTGAFAAEIATVKPAIFLLSGGGNDILGESMRQFLVKNAPAAAPGTQPERFFNAQFGAALDKLDELYHTIYLLLRQQSPDLHIIVHGYDYPIPNPVDSKKGWLGPYLDEFGIKDPADRIAISRYMMDGFNQRLLATSGPFEKVHYLDLRNIVQPNEWYDEIHPTDEGYQRVSLRFIQKIASLVQNAATV